MVRADRRVAFDDPESVAVEVTGPVEPGPIVVVSHIDDQRVPLPVPSRLPHPEAQCFRKLPPIRPDLAKGMAVLVRDDHQFRRLEDLKRVRQVGNAWDTGQVTIGQRVSGHPIFVILRLLGRCPRLVRDLQPLHDTLPPRHSLLSIVVLKIRGGRREGLPDTTQVRCAVRCTWELTLSLPGVPQASDHWHNTHHNDQGHHQTPTLLLYPAHLFFAPFTPPVANVAG